MMSLNEILACHSPPLLPGIIEIPAIKDMLLRATCFVAAKSINEDKRFLRYSCVQRSYLLTREPIILWDPNIFDPERHAMYSEEVAATTIQAAFKGYQMRKTLLEDSESEHINQKGKRAEPVMTTDDLSFEDDQYSTKYDEDLSGNNEKPSFDDKKPTIANRIRQSVTNFFKKASPSPSSLSVSEDNWKADNTQDRQTTKTVVDSYGRPYPEQTKHKPNNYWAEIRKQPKKISGKPKIKSNYSDSSTSMEDDPETEEKQKMISSSMEDLSGHVTRMVGDLDENKNQVKPINAALKKALPEAIHTTRIHTPDIEKTVESRLAVQEKIITSSHSQETESDESSSFRTIFIAGGFNADDIENKKSGKESFLYDPALSKWTPFIEMPRAIHHHRLVYFNNAVYSIGGCDPEITRGGKMVAMKHCFKFDLQKKKWLRICKLQHARMYHAVAVLNKKIFVVGGKDEEDRMLDSVEVYDPESDSWSELEDSLEQSIMGVGMCSHNGKLWVLGGMVQDQNGKMMVSSDVVCYNPFKSGWQRCVRKLPYPRAFLTAVVSGKKVYAIGGTTFQDEQELRSSEELVSVKDVLCYDEEKKKWREMTPLPDARHYVSAVTVGNSLFVIGGLTSYKRASLIDVLVLSQGEWHLSSNLPQPLCGYAAASVPKVENQQ